VSAMIVNTRISVGSTTVIAQMMRLHASPAGFGHHAPAGFCHHAAEANPRLFCDCVCPQQNPANQQSPHHLSCHNAAADEQVMHRAPDVIMQDLKDLARSKRQHCEPDPVAYKAKFEQLQDEYAQGIEEEEKEEGRAEQVIATFASSSGM
jgi:hypothetical protein